METIELWAFLKLKGLASTGGQAKVLIRSGDVHVNGVSETRVRKKLSSGDVVTVHGQTWTVTSEPQRT